MLDRWGYIRLILPHFVSLGRKTFLRIYRQYLIVVWRDENNRHTMETDSSGLTADSRTMVSIFDLKRKFIAYSGSFSVSVDHVVGMFLIYNVAL